MSSVSCSPPGPASRLKTVAPLRSLKRRVFGAGSPPRSLKLGVFGVGSPAALAEASTVSTANKSNESPLRAFFVDLAARERLRWDGLPSAGSALHWANSCRPCLLLRTDPGCEKGDFCDYCHFEHTRRQKMRPCKTKRDRYKKLVQRAQNSMSGSTEGGVGSGNSAV